jgi:PAS domain S-box-containing protein
MKTLLRHFVTGSAHLQLTSLCSSPLRKQMKHGEDRGGGIGDAAGSRFGTSGSSIGLSFEIHRIKRSIAVDDWRYAQARQYQSRRPRFRFLLPAPDTVAWPTLGKGVSMGSVDKALDRISRSGEAVFAMDGSNRIIYWNKASEELLGVPARAALGKPCFEVMDGRDTYGNAYCHRSCPVAHQAREAREHPVCPFELSVKTGDGSRKTILSSLFSIPSYHPALATLVHVFREGAAEQAANPHPSSREPLAPLVTAGGGAVELTNREQEILRCLAQGLATAAIGRKLFISAVTVRNHVQNILQKLDVHSKLAAVVFAYQRSLI